jgi:hypothetical protein
MVTKEQQAQLDWADAQIKEHRDTIALSEMAISDWEAFKRLVIGGALPPNAVPTIAAMKASGRVLSGPAPHDQGRLLSLDVNVAARGGKKRALLKAILSNPQGIGTADIVESLINMGLKDTTVGNTSPQLSVYKGDGLITLTDDGWKILGPGIEVLADYEKEDRP